MNSLAKSCIFHLLGLAVIAGCASRQEVGDDYREALGSHPAASAGKRTTVLFLVDGLGEDLLNRALREGRLPRLRRYFSTDTQAPFHAISPFPSLTYPAISSILTGKSIGDSGIYGNFALNGGRITDLSVPSSYPLLNEKLTGQTVFARLSEKGLRSVSFDYAFHTGSTAHTSNADLKAGLAIVDQDYAYVDNKTLESMRILLKKTPADLWPDFIFVHLVGVDFMSHELGQESPKVMKYLSSLDAQLGKELDLLEATEKSRKRQILAMLTADHGFDVPAKVTIGVPSAIKKFDDSITVLDEGRVLALFTPPALAPAKRDQLLQAIAEFPDIEMVASDQGNGRVQILSHGLNTELNITHSSVCGANGPSVTIQPLTQGPALVAAPPSYCADLIPEPERSLYHPYFIPNIARYFSGTAQRPDAVIVAKSGVAFNRNYTAQHGGPFPRETIVPLLLRGAKLAPGQTPALNQLLDFLH